MLDLAVPDMAWGVLGMAVGMLYSAWHDYKGGNTRDARLLAALGTVSLVGGAMACLQ